MELLGCPSICNICKENCGILVRKEGQDLHITGNPDHPISKGFICLRGRSFGEICTSPLRLQQPLLRKGASWLPITYDDAIAILAERISVSKKQYGAESVVFYKGESLKHQEISQYMSHLAHGFGTPNYITVGSLCHFAMTLGFKLTCGGMPAADYTRIKTAVVWGANPLVSLARSGLTLKKAVQDGLKLIVIDPSTTKTTEIADCHLQIAPGSDGYLALAFLQTAIFKYQLNPPVAAVGWADLKSLVEKFSLSDLLEPTGITKDQFERAASLMFNHRPGWIRTGSGLELQPNGVQTVRAIASLLTLLDPDVITSPIAYTLAQLPGKECYPPMADPIGKREWPLFYQNLGQGQGMHLPQAILDNSPYPVRAMVVVGGNPLATFPSTPFYKKAFGKLDFLAVFDLFITETAKMADLILPAATYLENLELIDYGRNGHPFLGLIRPVVHTDSAYPTWKFLFQLADTLGLKKLFPWQDNEEALRYKLNMGSISLDDLFKSSSSTAQYHPDTRKPGCWHTPDQKVHYLSQAVADTGNSPLPTPEGFQLPQRPDLQFPFWLSTGDRVPAYQHSQFRESPSCRSTCPKPVVEMHPDAARSLDINAADTVRLSTRHGYLETSVSLTTNVRKDSLRMTHGWQGADVNQLTNLHHLDPLSGFPWMRALPAKVEKICTP